LSEHGETHGRTPERSSRRWGAPIINACEALKSRCAGR
jgi:hypothetical protein